MNHLTIYTYFLQVKVGPESIGYRLVQEGVVFGGETLTASDLAVAGGLVEMGDATLLTNDSFTCNADHIKAGVAKIRQMIEDTIDQVKVNQ